MNQHHFVVRPAGGGDPIITSATGHATEAAARAAVERSGFTIDGPAHPDYRAAKKQLRGVAPAAAPAPAPADAPPANPAPDPSAVPVVPLEDPAR
jgi:hypothetical protein